MYPFNLQKRQVEKHRRAHFPSCPNKIPSTVCSPRPGVSVKQACLLSPAASLLCVSLNTAKGCLGEITHNPTANLLHNYRTKASNRIKTKKKKKKSLNSAIHLHNLVFEGI